MKSKYLQIVYLVFGFIVIRVCVCGGGVSGMLYILPTIININVFNRCIKDTFIYKFRDVEKR